MLKGDHGTLEAEEALRSVEVVVRIRPVEGADGIGEENCVAVAGGFPKRLTVLDPCGWCGAGDARSFVADTVLESGVSNEEVFRRVVKPKLSGVSKDKTDTLCFLAYGHTSSGKTHTIAGGGTFNSSSRPRHVDQGQVLAQDEEESGLLTLCVEELLQREGVVEVAMLEVYMENIYDLLAQGAQRHVRRRRSAGGETHVLVEGLKTCIITSREQWKAVARYGMRSRRTTATERNARSSRSHALFTVKSPSVRLCFVDLAGSERQTTFSAQLNKESVSINKSLSRLSTALQALSEQQPNPDGRRPYVNFRDTTLTVLLQRYLVGSSHTTFLACVHPAERNVNETMSTLRYTERIRRIKTSTRAAQEEDPYQDGMALYDEESNDRRLLEEIAELREKVRDHEEARQLLSTHQQRIAELEASLLEHQQKSSLVRTTSGSDESEAPQQQWKHQMQQENALTSRRLTRWLLTRVLRDLPPLHVRFDDYFDDLLPPSVQVVGYVSTLRCLPPRRAAKIVSPLSSSCASQLCKEEEGLCFLDVGDFSIGLSMLDGGVPSLVRLHQAHCTGVSTWEPYETRLATTLPPNSSSTAFSSRHGLRQSNPVVHFGYVLAFFQTSNETVEPEAIASSVDEEAVEDDMSVDKKDPFQKAGRAPGSPTSSQMVGCCAGRISKEPLVPIAVVWCVPMGAPLHVKESALQRLAMLVQHGDMTSALGITPQANRTHKDSAAEEKGQALHTNTLATHTTAGGTTVHDLSSTSPDGEGEQSRARQDDDVAEEEEEVPLPITRRPDPMTSLPLLKHINDVLLAVPSSIPTSTVSAIPKHVDVVANKANTADEKQESVSGGKLSLVQKDRLSAPLFHSDDEDDSSDSVVSEGDHRRASRSGALCTTSMASPTERAPLPLTGNDNTAYGSNTACGAEEERLFSPDTHNKQEAVRNFSGEQLLERPFEGAALYGGASSPQQLCVVASIPTAATAAANQEGRPEEKKEERHEGNSPPHYNAAVDYLRGVEREVENCLLRATTDPEEPVRSSSVSSSFYSEYDDSRDTAKEASCLPQDEAEAPPRAFKDEGDCERQKEEDEEEKQVLVANTADDSHSCHMDISNREFPVHPIACEAQQMEMGDTHRVRAAASGTSSVRSPKSGKTSKLRRKRNDRNHQVQEGDKAVELSKCQECIVM